MTTPYMVTPRHRDAPVVQEPEPMFEFRRPAWHAQAACHPDVIPDVWQPFGKRPVDLFYPEGPITAARRAAIESVCRECPVRSECLQHAIRHEEEGFWASKGSVSLGKLRRETRTRRWAPEVDRPTRLVLGTFIPPGHGTSARYEIHVREGNPPCAACREARRQRDTDRHSEEWADFKRTATPEEREARRDSQRQQRRKRG